MEDGTEPDSCTLKDGGEWIDHEDCIVGNDAGLRSLIEACNVALETGEYYGNDLGDYVGIKKLDDTWFENPQDSDSTQRAYKIYSVVVAGIVILVLALVVVGVMTVFDWLF